MGDLVLAELRTHIAAVAPRTSDDVGAPDMTPAETIGTLSEFVSGDTPQIVAVYRAMDALRRWVTGTTSVCVETLGKMDDRCIEYETRTTHVLRDCGNDPIGFLLCAAETLELSDEATAAIAGCAQSHATYVAGRMGNTVDCAAEPRVGIRCAPKQPAVSADARFYHRIF